MMPRKCKNPLATVTATISYYMTVQEITNNTMSEKLLISKPTWFDRKKHPEHITLGELSRIAGILDVDMTVLIGGLSPDA